MSGLSFDEIANTLGEASKKAEEELRKKMEELATENDISSADLLKMQAAMQKWNFMHELTAKGNERLGDTFKGIVQKS